MLDVNLFNMHSIYHIIYFVLIKVLRVYNRLWQLIVWDYHSLYLDNL